ncbi:MAG: tetratricopeptide repeat protein [Xanthobacteraceae bacterium]
MAAVEGIARALRGKGEYGEALSFFERLAIREREDKVADILAPGRATWQIDIACLHWLLGDYSQSIRLMHGLAAGILDGSIKYGDAAGGLKQGLLLYYMSITARNSEELSFASDYIRSRVDYVKNVVKRNSPKIWPCAVAQHYLGDVTFETVREAIDHPGVTLAAVDLRKVELARRRKLCVALFHDGVNSRAQGDDEKCLDRMRECCALEDPLIEQEWYLARYEIMLHFDHGV